jgi:hypothetical protein
VLGSLAGKAVLFLDTCHAAGAIENGSRRGLARLDINSVINEFASPGRLRDVRRRYPARATNLLGYCFGEDRLAVLRLQVPSVKRKT